MSTKRKGSSVGTNYNFRPPNDFQTKAESKGRKPLPKPISVGGALLTMLIFGCRKILFVNTNLRVAVYAGIFFLSYIVEKAPLPPSYFSRSSNIPNQYFVKLGWAWTLLMTVPFVLLTCFTYCCGNRRMVGWHLARLGVATAAWFIVTKSFSYIENNTGRCSVKREEFLTKQTCLSAGHFWDSLDISGHAFILVHSCLVIIEEARAICGWETIPDLLLNEEHHRVILERDLSSPLKNLTKEQLKLLKLSFKTFSPFIRGIFVGMTLLTCLWDIMIISTALYFHTMIEKLVGGLCAIVVWFITYKYWYSKTKLLPYAPGQGVFRYNKRKFTCNGNIPASRARQDLGPSFMGMPLYTNTGGPDIPDDDEISSTTKVTSAATRSAQNAGSSRARPITRSVGRPDGDLA